METEEEAFGYFFRKRCSAIFLVCCLVIAETVHVGGISLSPWGLPLRDPFVRPGDHLEP